MSDFLYKMDYAVRASLPVASCFVAILFAFAPWPPLVKALIQALPLLLLCFWVMHRPDLFSSLWSFLLGLLFDALAGQVIGLTAISFLLADFLLRSQRGFFRHHSFFASWLVASVVVIGAHMLPWVLVGMVSGFSGLAPTGLRIGFSILLFPVMAGLLYRWQPVPQEGV